MTISHRTLVMLLPCVALWACNKRVTASVPKVRGSVSGDTNTHTTTSGGTVDMGHAATWPSCAAAAPGATCVSAPWSVYPLATQPNVLVQSEHVALRSASSIITLEEARTTVGMIEDLYPAILGVAPSLEPYCQTTTKYKITVLVGETSPTYIYQQNDVYVIATSPDPPAQAELVPVLVDWLVATVGAQESMLLARVATTEYLLGNIPSLSDTYTSCGESFFDFPHLLPGARTAYCDSTFLEYIADTLCPSTLWSMLLHPPAQDPNADIYENLAASQLWTPDQLNDYMGEWMRHNVSWDYRDPNGADQSNTYLARFGAMSDMNNLPSNANGQTHWRQARTTTLNPLSGAVNRFAVPPQRAPQRFGYNAVQLFVKQAGTTVVRITFQGITQTTPANVPPPDPNIAFSTPLPHSDWRWGLVAVDGNQARYSALQSGSDAAMAFSVHPNDQLWLMVMATPSAYQPIVDGQPYYAVYRYPWMIELAGAWPQGSEPSRALPPGQAWPNGGGWVANNATVASSVYVSPSALVLGGTINGNVRIDDQAMVLDANVSGNAWIKGVSWLADGVTVTDNAIIDTTYRPIGGTFADQTLSGTVQLLGDAYLYGEGSQFSAVTIYGYQRTYPAPIAEVTAAPQYVWRP